MTIRFALRCALIGLLGSATLASAETTYLPGAAEVSGLAGARFSSTLELANPGAASATATIGLLPMEGRPAPAPVTRTLAAGESLRIEKALETLFGLAEGAAGTITVTSDAALLANLTTQNVAAAEGAYGLGLLPVPEGELLGAGETGHAIWVSQSADAAAGYRTNLSVTLVDAGTVVEVRVLDAAGAVVGTATATAASPAVWQRSVASIAGSADLPVARAEFAVKAGRATAYAVVNDNVTSDAIALQTERVVAGATDRLVSGAALSPGHLGSYWVTDVRLFNPGPGAVEATIRSVGAPAESSTRVTVPAKGVVEVARVLEALGLPERTACALRVTAGEALLVAARTNNVDPSGVRKGTFSAQQFVTAWPAGLLGAGAVGYFAGVDQTLNVPGVRTNLTIVGGPEGASGELVLRDAAGLEQGRAPFSRGPGEWGQLGVADWFAAALRAALSADGLSLATVPPNARVDVAVAAGSLDAFVSRIDNGSGDAVTRPVALPGGGDCSKVAITAFSAAPLPVKPGVGTTFSWTVLLDPPTADLTAQSIQFDGEAPVELDKDARSYARTFGATGPRTATLTVRKGSCVKTRTLELFVCPDLTIQPAPLPDATLGANYGVPLGSPGAAAPAAFALLSGTLPAGVTLSPAGLLSGAPSTTGSFAFTVGVTDANGCTGSRTLELRVLCPPVEVLPAALSPGTVGTPYGPVTFDPVGAAGGGSWTASGLPPGLTLSAGGTLSGTPTAAGTYTVGISFADAAGCGGGASYTLVICNPIAVTPTTLAAGTAGVALAPVTFLAGGAVGATTWTVSAGSLPAGVTLDPSSGTLSGTPTVVGTFPFTVTATDSLGCTGSAALSLTVNCPAIAILPAGLANGVAGVAYSPVTLTQTGAVGTVAWAVTAGALPAGTSLAPATGLLSGTPTVTGTFNFTVTATDANGCTGTRAYSLTVDCPTIVLSPSSLANGTAGVAYSPVTVTQTGGVGAVTFQLFAGSLPNGMTLSPAGVLSGTPLQTGAFPITVRATDANGCIGDLPLSLTIVCPTITVSPASVPNGTAGVAYAGATFTQAGGVGTITWSLSSGTLPTGMTLDPATGLLSGTPSQTGSFPITVRATDANLCFGERTLTLTVDCPTIAVNPSSVPNGTPGVAYAGVTFTQAGGVGTITWSVSAGALPSGVTLNAATGLLSGTPLQTGAFPITVRATDANLCFGERTLTLTIVCPTIAVAPPTLPGGTVGTLYDQSVSASGGGGTYLYSVVPGTLPPGLSLNGASGAITGTPTTAGLYAFTVTATDQYGCSGATSYSVRICPVVAVSPAAAPQATINLSYGPVAFSQTGGALPIAWSASGLPAGLSIDAASGELSGTPTQAGGFSVTVTATDANGCPGSVSFTLRVCPEMSISPASLANGVVGTAYGPVTFAQSGSAASITWSATGLPAGLTLDPNTGGLSGTPETPGSSSVLVTATDANGCSVSRSYTLVIDCPAITLAPGTLPAGTAGAAYSATISASSALAGGTYGVTVSSGSLPPGLSLAAGGALTGTPTAVGTFDFTVRATHSPSGCTGEKAYSITVTCATIAIGGGAPPTGVTVGVAGYTHTFTASGGLAPYVYSHTGTLPTGLTLSAAGVLSGTPTATGTFDFTIVATDAATGATCTGSAPFSVTVVCPTITVSPATLPDGSQGVSYSGSVTATGGTGPYTFAVTAGTFPPGLTLGSDGSITGSPTTAGDFTFTVTATDTVTGCTGSRPYTVKVCPVITLTAITTCTEVGASYSSTITAPAGTPTVTFASTGGTVPPGLTLATNGTLSGTPTTAGQYTFTVTATDGNSCTGSQAYTVNVLGLTPAAGALPEATFGSAYGQTFTASGGSGAFTFAVTAGSIPGGLALSADGVLSGTPAGATGTGSFSFTVTATNTATGCTIARAYTLVSRPVAQANSYTDGAGNTEYYAGGFAPTPTTPFVSSATNVLANDLGPGLTAAIVTQPANGTVTLDANGSFRYTPAAGAETSAVFTYRVASNGVDSLPATVTITLVGQVWYVNSSGPNGTGTSSSPFNAMTGADTASGAGDVVFVHTGGATTTGAISLAAGQTLWGQGTAFTLPGSGLSIAAGGKPTLTGTVTIGGNDVTVSSLNLSTGSSAGIVNTGTVTGITVKNDVVVTTTTGTAVSFSNLTATSGGAPGFGVNFRSVSSSGAVSGIALTNVNVSGGTFTVLGDGTLARNGSGGTITASQDDGVALTNAHNVTLQSMNLTSNGNTATDGSTMSTTAGDQTIQVSGGSNVVLTGLLVQNPTGSGLVALNVGGTNRVTGSLFTGLADGNRHAVFVDNLNTNMALLEFRGNTVNASFADATSVWVSSSGTSSMTVDVKGCVFEDLDSQALQVVGGGTAASSGTLTSTIGGPNLADRNIFRNAKTFVGGTGATVSAENNLSVWAANGGRHVATVENNLLENVARDGLVANTSILRTQNAGGQLTATVRSNVIQNIAYAAGAGGRHAIGHVFEPPAYNAGDFSRLTVQGNTVSNVTYSGTSREFLFVDYRDLASGGFVEVLNNSFDMPTPGTQQLIELRFRPTNASTIGVEVVGNTGTGSTANAFLDIDSEQRATVNATVTGNTFTNANGAPGPAISAASETAGLSFACVNVASNTLAAAGNSIELAAAGTMNVTQASSAAMGAANGGATVSVSGAPVFGQAPCPVP